MGGWTVRLQPLAAPLPLPTPQSGCFPYGATCCLAVTDMHLLSGRRTACTHTLLPVCSYKSPKKSETWVI